MLSMFNGPHAAKQEPDYATLVKNGAMIVDVRTPGEFNSGHIQGSINIPLDLIDSKTEELKNNKKVIITCCRSGSRSGMAMSMLTAEGIECYNGGPWNILYNKI